MEWTTLSGTALQGIAKAVGCPVEKAQIAPLSFYTNGDILGVDGKLYIAAGDCSGAVAILYELDGTSDPIHEANGIAGLSITDDSVAEYLAFFNMMIETKEGAFHVMNGGMVEGRYLHDPIVKMEDGDYLIECFAGRCGIIYKCEFNVTTSGDVEMLSADMADPNELPFVN